MIMRNMRNYITGHSWRMYQGSPLKGLLLMVVMLLLFGSCIKDDIPYPRIRQNILALVAEGESGPAAIDSISYEVNVYLKEDVDIQAVKFTEYRISEGGSSDPDLLEGTYDMTDPLEVKLTLYQEYTWTITANQDIERYFEIEGQIGESVIDPVAHRVIVSVPRGTNTSDLILKRVKLGAEGVSTMVPDLSAGVINLSKPLDVEVTTFGRTETWTIYVELIETLVSTTNVVPWSEVIWAYGTCPSDKTGGFEYRETGESEWISLDARYVTQEGGAFSAYIPHLKPLMEYSVRAVIEEEKGNEIKVTTEGTADIPDGDFEQWWKDGSVWYPYAEGGEQFWDTGNVGAASLGQSNVVPTDYTVTGSGQAAKLETRFVGLGIFGKLAAGSIYTGKFARVDIPNGILDFGRPWTLRPTRLRGYFQYETADINYVDASLSYMKGEPDTCHIYVALTDWSAPYEIRTNPKSRQLFDSNASYIIAYGELVYSGKMDKYKEFTIDLEYRDKTKVPSYLQITCATSKYGDYFTGGTGAVLYVDQFSFDWDYPDPVGTTGVKSKSPDPVKKVSKKVGKK